MRILVVEDEQDLNRILAKTLIAEGYSVDAALTAWRRWTIWRARSMTPSCSM